MGRQMVSISFKKALENDGDSDLFLLPPQIPCKNLRKNAPPWEALFVGDPNLNPYAEERLWGNPKNCSLLGITHTLSTPAPLKIIPKIPYSPLFKWDALICTSTAAQNAVKTIWDHSDEILMKRGGKPAERPQLPLIPLGVNANSLLPQCSRKDARRQIHLPEDAVVVLWTGRFELHCKAHHGATFSALAHAAAAVPEKKWILLMYGTAIMPEIPTALEEAAKHLCPNVDVWLLDGHNIQLGDLARTASDMAISLVDCLQETFGLAPVEAMASGLPVVVSNWDGYRDTVVDGRTGYLIETHSFEPGWNNQINQQLAVNENALNEVSTVISSQIGVDTLAAGGALAKLAKSPQMAVAMGALGQQRVRELYDWPIVLNDYRRLLDELKSIREESVTGIETSKPIPELAEIFSEWPSKVISKETAIKAAKTVPELEHYLELKMIQIYKEILPSRELILQTFELINKNGITSLNQLNKSSQSDYTVINNYRFLEAVGWLLKHGFAQTYL